MLGHVLQLTTYTCQCNCIRLLDTPTHNGTRNLNVQDEDDFCRKLERPACCTHASRQCNTELRVAIWMGKEKILSQPSSLQVLWQWPRWQPCSQQTSKKETCSLFTKVGKGPLRHNAHQLPHDVHWNQPPLLHWSSCTLPTLLSLFRPCPCQNAAASMPSELIFESTPKGRSKFHQMS